MSWYGSVRGAGVPGVSRPGFLAPGHYLPRNLPLVIEFPQTTAAFGGTAPAYAAQFWAYLDGVNDWLYSFQIVPRGGSGPYVFEIITAPPGMQFGLTYWPAGWTPAQVLTAGYGRILWRPLHYISPSTGWSGTVGVRIYSQEYQTDKTQFLEQYFPLATVGPYNATNGTGFIFNSQGRGSDSASGTWSAPFLTLTKIYGADSTLPVTFPGAILALLDGTFESYNQGNGNAGAGIVMYESANPMSIIGNLDATSPIVLDITNNTGSVSAAGGCFTTYLHSPGVYFSNFQFNGVPTTQPNSFRYFQEGYGASQLMYDTIGAPNVYSGADPTGNSSLISLETPGGSKLRSNVVMHGCWETNRLQVPGAANNFGLHDLYAVASGVTQFCSMTGDAANILGYYLKDSCSNYVMRYNLASGTSLGVMGTGCQPQTSSSNNIEIEYNNLVNVNGLALRLNFAGSVGEPGAHWIRRNSIKGAVAVDNVSATGFNGPYKLQGNAIEWGTAGGNPSPQAIMVNSGSGYSGGALPSNIVDTETECEAVSGVMDANGNLTGSYLQYQYVRGAGQG